jgi:formylglycine-generating enzyme required for sulfatase activity
MARIFISYRRDDTGGYSLLVFDRLARYFGRDHVFMDIDTIEPGADFVRAIENAVGACDALIALIGKQWLTIRDERGQRRLDVPDDYVRLEIAAALERDIRVIPVLVRGAAVPLVDDLPEPLKLLARRNAISLSDERIDYDLQRLIGVLVKITATASWLDRMESGPVRRATGNLGVKMTQPDAGPNVRTTHLLFEPELVHIASGVFMAGDDQTQLSLPDYWISKYPVKVGEYRAFVQDGGYKERRYWTDAGWYWRETAQRREPEFWQVPTWTQQDVLPVVGVTWYEAYAYCRWLAEKTALPYRLPTSLEWEKAARGIEGHTYPWGNEKRQGMCNVYAAKHGRTVPVGTYSPGGDSPFGVVDMIGNVAEWTLTRWTGSKSLIQDNDPEGTSSRVQHGCGWPSVNLIPPSLRLRGQPDSACNYVGFRVARGRE